MSTMKQTIRLFGALMLLGSLLAGGAMAKPPSGARGAPIFMPALFADGETWGTNLLNPLPPPNDSNDPSFDELFVFVNSTASGQLSVAEAAPGNPYYNGGRWAVSTAMWTASGDPSAVLTSYDEILDAVLAGELMIIDGPPAGGPPPYFECPLLPVLYD